MAPSRSPLPPLASPRVESFAVVRLEGERRVQIGDGAFHVALRQLDLAACPVGVPSRWRQFERGDGVRHGAVQIAAHEAHRGAKIAGCGVVRLEGDGLSRVGHGAVEVPFGQAGGGSMIAGGGVIRIDINRPARVHQSPVHIAARQLDRATPAEGLGGVRRQFNGLGIISQRVFRIAAGRLGVGAQNVSRGRIWLKHNGARVIRDGALRVPLPIARGPAIIIFDSRAAARRRQQRQREKSLKILLDSIHVDAVHDAGKPHSCEGGIATSLEGGRAGAGKNSRSSKRFDAKPWAFSRRHFILPSHARTPIHRPAAAEKPPADRWSARTTSLLASWSKSGNRSPESGWCDPHCR